MILSISVPLSFEHYFQMGFVARQHLIAEKLNNRKSAAMVLLHYLFEQLSATYSMNKLSYMFVTEYVPTQQYIYAICKVTETS